jgi:hypothetical protein
MLFAAVHESLSGTKQSVRCSHRMSVVGGEAENIRSVRVFRILVESRCGAVALGKTYLLPPLSFGGASMVPPWLRFHIHRVAGGGRPPRLPQNVACGFPAPRSSAVGSQLSLLSVQVSFPWSADLLTE